MDAPEFVAAFARAAVNAGASALRIESIAYVKAVRAVVSVPIIGIVKRDLADSPVRITPFVSDAEGLCEAGADIVAFDATDRARPETVETLVAAVKRRGKLTMADCASIEDAERALGAGVDFVGTTLSGYVTGQAPTDPDTELVASLRRLTPFVVAEGRIRTPQQAQQAVRAGAYAVVIGSAITRTEHVTAWFREALESAYGPSPSQKPVLAIDIGGTKTMAALVQGSEILSEVSIATERAQGPDAWLAAARAAAEQWNRAYDGIGLAVTGFIRDGRWSAMNPETLGIPEDYPLVDRATDLFGMHAFAINDAQAAAWGEYRFGAGRGGDLVFLTVSTGVGGGIVINGRPLAGLAGHFGLTRGVAGGAPSLEDEASGRWMHAEAARRGHPGLQAFDIFKHARASEGWAEGIVSQSAGRIARLCRDIQLILDPQDIVIGGGVGLAEGYLDLVAGMVPGDGGLVKPNIVRAKLGGKAGVVGVADLVRQRTGHRL
ncbi:putative N-acetylmannosamine-6-phosphate 2-epimerase [Pararhizobium gei]|uniref:putative N-acetylmannosamine-6-phosphate 2-epimerase n=1 Tax=Pararhizobium gei TaxID=1395951 RepID=UPI0023DB9BA2|nr:putative N-acetylmannosamine-6-phosphate 2-epimerase [Rhizobium gei]